MAKYRFSSWLLRRLLPGAHAEAILGDLLEVSGADDDVYRRLLRGTVWSLGRRSLAAYVAAVLGGGMMVALQSEFFASLAEHNADVWQRSWGSTLAFLAGSMALMLCFSAVRYGLRDRVTLIALACTVPGALAVEFWWVPAVPVALGMGFLAFAALGLLRGSTRRVFLSVMTLALLQPVVWFGGLTLLITPAAALVKHFPLAMHAVAPLAVTWLVASYLVLVLLACVSYAKVHRMTAGAAG